MLADLVPAELVHHWLQGATATWQLEEQCDYRTHQGLPPREVSDYYVHVLGPPSTENTSDSAKVHFGTAKLNLEDVPCGFHVTGGPGERLEVYAMMLNKLSKGHVSKQFGMSAADCGV